VSAQALTAAAGIPTGELAILQRVQQLQGLIESAHKVAAGGLVSSSATSSSSSAASSAYPQTSNADFASALQAATTAGAAGAGNTATVADTSSLAGTSGVAYQPLQSAAGSGESSEYESLIEQAAARNGVDPAVLHGLIEQESGFDPSAVSSAGASGLTQLMPGTASSLGVANTLNPVESIEGGARYLGELTTQFGGNTEDALAAYNAGPGAVEQYGGIPPYSETQSYVAKVLANAEAFRQAHPSTVPSGGLV
jgi:soluble lytic murein transglycosylase-like protein